MTDSESELARLKAVVDQLRHPEEGCPWDLDQTPRSLTPYLLEEAHEAAEAIRNGRPSEIRGELGNVLFNVFLQIRLAEEDGQFELSDVASEVADKIVRRHPHVFGDERGLDREAIRRKWREIKEQENPDRTRSALQDLPASLPALFRAERIGLDAARVGFDWADWAGPRAKILEELSEIEEAVAGGDPDAIRHEVGDLLLAVTSLCRHLGLDGEGALREATDRFRNRFQRMEATGQALESLDLEELESLWRDAKASES